MDFVKTDMVTANKFLTWKLEKLYSQYQSSVGQGDFDLRDDRIKSELEDFRKLIYENTRLYYEDSNIVGFYISEEDMKSFIEDEKDRDKQVKYQKLDKLFDRDDLFNYICKAEESRIDTMYQFYKEYRKSVDKNHSYKGSLTANRFIGYAEWYRDKASEYARSKNLPFVSDIGKFCSMMDEEDIRLMVSLVEPDELLSYGRIGEKHNIRLANCERIEHNANRIDKSLDSWIKDIYDTSYLKNVEIVYSLSGERYNAPGLVKNNVEDSFEGMKKLRTVSENKQGTGGLYLIEFKGSPRDVLGSYRDFIKYDSSVKSRRQLLVDAHPVGEQKLSAKQSHVSEMKAIQDVNGYNKVSDEFKRMIRSSGWTVISDKAEALYESNSPVTYFAASCGPYVIAYSNGLEGENNLNVYRNRKGNSAPKINMHEYQRYDDVTDLKDFLQTDYKKVAGVNVDVLDMSAYRRMRGVAVADFYEKIANRYLQSNPSVQELKDYYKEYANKALNSLMTNPVTQNQLDGKQIEHEANAGAGAKLPFAIVENYPKQGKFSLVGCELNGKYVYAIRDNNGVGYDSREEVESVFYDKNNRESIRDDYFRVKNGINSVMNDVNKYNQTMGAINNQESKQLSFTDEMYE